MLKEVCFFEIRTPGKLGELCAENLSARRGVRVVGRLKEERLTDGRGNTHRKVFVVAEHVEIKPNGEGGELIVWFLRYVYFKVRWRNHLLKAHLRKAFNLYRD